jgi:hypothetical protein
VKQPKAHPQKETLERKQPKNAAKNTSTILTLNLYKILGVFFVVVVVL